MGKEKSIKLNFILNVILTASTLLFPLITFPYISRVILPGGVGKVNFATSVVSYFSMIAMLGVPTYGIRACAKVRDDKEKLTRTVHEILMINLLVTVVTYIAYALAVINVAKLRADSMLFLIMSFTIIFNVIGVEWLYKGLEQYSYITIRSIVFKVIALVLMFVFVRTPSDYVIYGAITIVAGVGSNFLNFINLRKLIYLKPVGNYDLKRHLKPVGIFFLMSVAITLYTNLDTVMLGFMKDDTEVGYYTAAVKIKGMLVSFVTALSSVLLPRVSYYIEQGNEKEFVRMAKKALNFVVLVALPVVIYFVLYARESILFLSGSAFEPAILPMQIITPTVLLIGLTNVLGIQILVPIGCELAVCISVLAGAAIDFVINFICIPRWASSGAALGTLVAEFVVLVVQLIILRKQIREFFAGIQVVKIVLATAVSAFVCSFAHMIPTANIVKLLISAIVFFVVYGTILLLSKEQMVIELFEDIRGKLRAKRQ